MGFFDGTEGRNAGFPDAEERQAKSLLSIAIRRHINALGITQAEAARRLGIHRPRMSEIWNNHVGSYTIDHLSDILKRLGAEMKITISYNSQPAQVIPL